MEGTIEITLSNQTTGALKSIAPIGWHVPSYVEQENLCLSIGTIYDAGGHVKETGFTYWESPNTGADNSSGFSALGAGGRGNTGAIYSGRGFSTIFWATEEYWDDTSLALSCELVNDSAVFNVDVVTDKNQGCSIRCVKDSTLLSIGETGTVTDINGNIYPTKCMPDGKEWMLVNLCVTHYNDGTPIPRVDDSTTWDALTTGAMCYYDNVIPGLITLSIDRVNCRYHNDGTPYDPNSFVVTHSDPYTYSWSVGTHFTVTVFEDTMTVTANGANSSGANYTDVLTIRMGLLSVTFGVVQFKSPD
jgi:uncharacterized protein (TIGR02145 family)